MTTEREETTVNDMLLQDVPDDVVAAVDHQAHRLGLSRSDYLRRVLQRERRTARPVTTEHFGRLAGLVPDLDDPEEMSAAWS